jgi:adenosylcobinamide-phosphate synthase
MEVTPLGASLPLLLAACLLDALFGDPEYRAHPVRLIGHSLSRIEAALRAAGFDGYLGGIVLFIALSGLWCGVAAAFTLVLHSIHRWLAIAFHAFWLYSLLAFRDLLAHVWRVERAARSGDLAACRRAVSMLVGRDTANMDAAACRRAAIESLSENLVDGVLSPIFWYALLGLPGVTLFKVVSTMDSMVGYKSPRYVRFGWCGARVDDLMNWVPARIAWLLIALAALFIPGCSARRALTAGWRQHALVPGPNSGWSEAGCAGAIRRRLAGPIYAGGALVTEIWLGHPEDLPAGGRGDITRAALLCTLTAVFYLCCIGGLIAAFD